MKKISSFLLRPKILKKPNWNFSGSKIIIRTGITIDIPNISRIDWINKLIITKVIFFFCAVFKKQKKIFILLLMVINKINEKALNLYQIIEKSHLFLS